MHNVSVTMSDPDEDLLQLADSIVVPLIQCHVLDVKCEDPALNLGPAER